MYFSFRRLHLNGIDNKLGSYSFDNLMELKENKGVLHQERM